MRFEPRRLCLQLSTLLVLGLTQAAHPPAPPPSPAGPSAGSLAEVMRRAHFSFREVDGAFTGGHTSYETRVTAGQIELTGAVASASPFRLGATRAHRGDVRLSTSADAPRRNLDGTVSVDLGGLEEQLENGPEGLEQRWRFEGPPRGAGDLSVQVPVSAHYEGTDPRGLRFSVGALAYRYSHATWVDARGRRTEVPARYTGTDISLVVPDTVLQATAWPAVLDPLISAEIALDPGVSTAAALNQDSPAIAWSGSQYLAVWTDGRGPGSAANIYGTRISAAGAVLDPTGILISTVRAVPQVPAVASNGADFMVVWSDLQLDGFSDIVAARVTAGGVALDGTGAVIASAPPMQDAAFPAIAWSGASYLVVWAEEDMGSAANIGGVRVDQNRATLGTSFTVNTSGVGLNPDLAWDGSNFLVVWHQIGGAPQGIVGRRYSATGTATTAPFLVTTSGSVNPQQPAVAWNGSTHLVVWRDTRVPANAQDIYGARVPATGTSVTDPAGFNISTAANDQIDADVTAAGATFFVSWRDSRSGGTDVYGAQVNGTTVTPALGIAVNTSAGNQLAPVVASDGTNVMAVWAQFPLSGSSDVVGTLINAAGVVQTPAGTLLSTGANLERAPAVAWSGTNYLVVWEDERASSTDIYGVRVSAAGVPLDATAFVISNAANTQSAPAVAWTGSNYLVVWQDDRMAAGNFDIYGARVSATGVVTDPAGFVINSQANSQQLPVVASDGTNALVVWQDERASAGTEHLFGTRVSGASVLDGTGVAIGAGISTSRERRPTVAWNGTTYFLAWEAMTTALGTPFEVHGLTVSSSMVLGPRTVYAPAAGALQRFDPAVGATAGVFLLAWRASVAVGFDIVGVRLNSTGGSLGSVTLADTVSNELAVAVAGDGTNFEVVWEDGTNGFANSDLRCRRVVAATGAVLDGPTGQVLSAGVGSETAAALASSGPRSFLAVYQAFVLGPNAVRARARVLSNAPPAATSNTASTNEDTSVGITLTGTDADGDALTFAIVASPSNGMVTGTPPNVTYQPAPNFNGADSFTFRANDSIVDSPVGTITITVNAVNDAPVANPQNVSTPEDTSRAITLTGSDVESSPLTFTVLTNPTLGILTGTAPNLTYQPTSNLSGPDSFTFRVRDGTTDSAPATVSINVTPVNDPPTALPQSLSTNEEVPLAITLTGTDAEGALLAFAVVNPPPNGSLSGTPPNLTYTPNLNFNGSDSFQFTANDGAATSPAQTISIIVNGVNDAPVAQNQAVGGPQDQPLTIVLVGTDVDVPSTLSYSIVTAPTSGTLSPGIGATRTYTPNTGFRGNDSFTFRVNDGLLNSNTATVSISINSVNQAPTANGQSVTTAEDTQLTITLTGSDPDGDMLNFLVTAGPSNGTLGGTGASRTYTPAPNFNGADSFTFRVNDGRVDSAQATVTIIVSAVNDAPVAQTQNVSTLEDTPLAVVLSGSDVDLNPLIFIVTVQPLHGTLSGMPPNLTYTPALNYTGFDAFSFKANDGMADSVPAATVNISVGPVNDAPVANSQMVMTDQDTPRSIMLTATDADGDFLLYAIVTQPLHGAVMGTPPNVTYVPTAGYRGNDSFTFKASDPLGDSAPATVAISVASVNHAPVVMAQMVMLDEDSDAGITVAATDEDGDALTFSVVAQPQSGTVSQRDAGSNQFVYTPNPNFRGSDFFTVKANDLFVDSAPARIDLIVRPVNDPPVALMQDVSTPEDQNVTVVLTGQDVDADPLSFRIVGDPAHGSLALAFPNVTYAPSKDYFGDDTFTFVVSDGTVESAPATVTVRVAPVNDAPSAVELNLSTELNTPVPVMLQGSDLDGDALTFTLVEAQAPKKGTLTGTPPDLTYVPNAGASGADEFGYVVNDGKTESPPARVLITIGAGGATGIPQNAFAKVNGWTPPGCGCGQSGAGPALLGLMWLVLRRRRRVPAAAVVALCLSGLTASAWAKPAAKKKVTPPPPTIIQAPPAAPEPTPPAVVESPPPVSKPVPVALPSMAVLEVQVTVPNEKLDSAAFSEMLVSAVDQGKLFKVISAAEVATLIGVERQKQLLGCGEESCLTEISAALGSRYLLQGAVGKVGDNYLVTVRLIDAQRSVVVGRSSTQTSDVSQLLGLIWRSTQDAVDAAAANLPSEEKERWLARPREEPTTVKAPPTFRLGVSTTAVGGFQPLGIPGQRLSFGGEVDVTLRLGRIDLGAGVVISPYPGARATATFAVLATRSRVGVGVRGVYFPGAAMGGGGLVATYEFALTPIFGLRALVASEVYAGAPSIVLALLGGAGVEAHF